MKHLYTYTESVKSKSIPNNSIITLCGIKELGDKYLTLSISCTNCLTCLKKKHRQILLSSTKEKPSIELVELRIRWVIKNRTNRKV